MKYQLKPRVVTAVPMTKRAYCEKRGWDVPFDEDGDEVGMFITYDGLDRCTWVCMKVFDDAYAVMGESTPVTRLTEELEQNSERLSKLTLFLNAQQKLTEQNKPPIVGPEMLRSMYYQQILMRELNAILTTRLSQMTTDNNPL
jgi:hypothetical protein